MFSLLGKGLLSDKIIAYIAGLFDGEGSVYIDTINGDYNLVCKIAVIDQRIPNMLEVFFGGSVNQSKKGNYRILYRWQITNGSAKPFLEAIRPYLTIKATEVWLALEYLEQKTIGHKTRPVTVNELALRNGYRLALQEAKKLIGNY